MKREARSNQSEFTTELTTRIRAKIRELRRIGTVAMGLENLLQVTRPPSHTLQGAPVGGNLEWQYAQLFREVCNNNTAIRGFLL